jgi:hypothetical protein
MSRDEQIAYRRYIDDRVILADQIVTARGEGKLEGRAEERMNNARNLKANGVPMEVIIKSLGLTDEEAAKL